MRITDPRWPAVREFARILLRTEGLVVSGPTWLEALLHALNIRLGDVQPSRTNFLEFTPMNDGSIELNLPHKSSTLAVCSEGEPPLETVWVPMDVESGWQAIAAVIGDLLDAGYPGCLGCGGPHTEDDWDEYASRKKMQNQDESTS